MELSTAVVDVNAENIRDLIEKSQTSTIVFMLWTDQMPQSVSTKEALTQLASSYGDKLVIGLVDVAQDPTIAQQLGVRAIPSIRVIQEGKIAGQLEGPQSEPELREFLDPYTLSSADLLKQQIATHIENQEWDDALGVLQEAIKEEPTNHLFRVECADVMILKGDLEAAKQILDTVPDAVNERIRPVTRLEIAQEAAAMGSLDEVTNAVNQSPDDLETRYKIAILLSVAGRYEEALKQAMHILQTDRGFRDDIGRETMVRIFHLLGNESSITKNYRRKMFAFMH